MAINIPESSSVVKSRVKADIRSKLSRFNPLIKGDFLGALADSISERVYDFFRSINYAIDDVFPDTTQTNINRWGSIYRLPRKAASVASGTVIFRGSLLSDSIPAGSKFVDSNGRLYTTQAIAGVSIHPVIQTTLTKSGTTATFNCNVHHLLKTGDEITIFSAADVLFNGVVTVTVIDEDTFEYQVPAGAGASTTGASFLNTAGVVIVHADNPGSIGNLSPFTPLTLQASVLGINDDCVVDYQGLLGGSDIESVEAYRERILDAIANPISHFNIADIERVAKKVTTITRVFVKEITPAVGQVTIYVMSDNEESTIPNAAKVAEVKSAILAIKPANTSDADVIVAAPTQVSVNFIFTSLNPNTQTMRDAITENLKQFFAQNADVGVSLTSDMYRSAIFQTRDLVTGQKVTSFAISAPAGTVAISSSQIGTLGSITWP